MSGAWTIFRAASNRATVSFILVNLGNSFDTFCSHYPDGARARSTWKPKIVRSFTAISAARVTDTPLLRDRAATTTMTTTMTMATPRLFPAEISCRRRWTGVAAVTGNDRLACKRYAILPIGNAGLSPARRFWLIDTGVCETRLCETRIMNAVVSLVERRRRRRRTKDPGNGAIVSLIERRAPELRARDVTLRIYGEIALSQFSRCALLSTAYIRVLCVYFANVWRCDLASSARVCACAYAITYTYV